MKNHIEDLLNYNVWANAQISDYVLKAGDEKADLEQVSSFSTIRKTLLHLWDGQVIWMTRLQGNPISTWPSKSFTGSLQEASDGLIENSRDFVRYLEKCDDSALASLINYHTMDGKEHTNSIAEILLHLMNHGTYHRGQLITMLRVSGFNEVGSTDLMRYYRTVKNVA